MYLESIYINILTFVTYKGASYLRMDFYNYGTNSYAIMLH